MTGHVPTTAPDRMPSETAARLRRLAFSAAGLLPPHIAKLVAKEITDHADFGYALGSHGVVHGLAADLEDLQRQRVQREADEWAAKTARKTASDRLCGPSGSDTDPRKGANDNGVTERSESPTPPRATCAGETCSPSYAATAPNTRRTA